jgi:thioredoxin 1
MWKNILIVLAVLLVVGGVAYFKEAGNDVPGKADRLLTDTRPAVPKLVELGAGKCQACKEMKPIIDSLKKDYAGQLAVEYIDVHKQHERAEAYEWQLIPCQVFIDPQGRELWRHEGFLSREAILAKWAELGFEFKDDV